MKKILKLKSITFRPLLIISLSLLIIISCSKDNSIDLCGEEYFGEFKLLDNARNSIPYLKNTSLFFQDSTGSQVVYEFLYEDGGYGPLNISSQTRCKFDETKQKISTATGDIYHYVINETTQSLGMRFSLQLAVSPFEYDSVLVSDRLGVGISSELDSTSFVVTLSLIVNPRELTEEQINYYPKSIDEINLLNRTFYNVYTNTDSSLFYNYELGLIGFKDREGNLWVLDKTEY